MITSKGFTLVELLVTVAITGILASMSVITFQEYRTKAIGAKVIIYTRDLITASSLIIDDLSNNATTYRHYFVWVPGTRGAIQETPVNYTPKFRVTEALPYLMNLRNEDIGVRYIVRKYLTGNPGDPSLQIEVQVQHCANIKGEGYYAYYDSTMTFNNDTVEIGPTLSPPEMAGPSVRASNMCLGF